MSAPRLERTLRAFGKRRGTAPRRGHAHDSVAPPEWSPTFRLPPLHAPVSAGPSLEVGTADNALGTYLRIMHLRFPYRLGYRQVVAEVDTNLSCRLALSHAVPDEPEVLDRHRKSTVFETSPLTIHPGCRCCVSS